MKFINNYLYLILKSNTIFSVNSSTMQFPYWEIGTPEPAINQQYSFYMCKYKICGTNNSILFYGHHMEDQNYQVVLKFVKHIINTDDTILNELKIMKDMDHPNLLKAEDSFYHGSFFCIVTKYAPFGNLASIVKDRYSNGMPESEARIVMRQLLEAVGYLHSKGIWHRDIKPNNALVYMWSQTDKHIILADYGLSKHFDENDYGFDFTGTPEYSAPEMFKKTGYTQNIDFYSLGITLFFLLSGRSPFPNRKKYPKVFFYKVTTGKLNMQLLQAKKCSLDCIEFINQMCHIDPLRRISTASDAINHTWMRTTKEETSVIGKELMGRIKPFEEIAT